MRTLKTFILIFFFLFNFNYLFGNINNSIIISVGNLPITYLDLLKEMRMIAILTNNKINDENKEQIKTIAVQSLIKRKVKEVEIKKYNIDNFSKNDLNKLILNASRNIGTDPNGLKNILESNQLKIIDLKNKFEVDLKWNSLIFQLYKNKIVLNMAEIENKIKSEIENTTSSKKFLLSEIEIEKSENSNLILEKIFKNIQNEGFDKTAKKFSISLSAEYGGNIGWVEQKNLSKKILENVKDLKNNEISKPIILDNTIVIVKKTDQKVFKKNVENIKNRVLKEEKEKKLQMFSKAHFSNLERLIQINFL